MGGRLDGADVHGREHQIVMALTMADSVAGPGIDTAEAVDVSYPGFFQEMVMYWLSQAHLLMLVVRTSAGKISWMNANDYLRSTGETQCRSSSRATPSTEPNVPEGTGCLAKAEEN